MRHIGRIMRAAVEGTLQLVAVRASTKHEMRAVVTQIQASNNNPLKFSPDAVSGLEQLLSPPQRGFLDGASAMDEVMVDLVGHSIGTVAGMRAAIQGVLDRYDPEALEAKLGAGSLLANLLPAGRKARLWELYVQHHRRIRDEAEEDFHTVFGRAFVAAYEEQVERLDRQRRNQRAAPRARR
ncbi:MAG: type VI secretion system-associated FHA domain protein TagH [Rubrivivax sp.]|nr:type VI secretion system-associated FHA domain protein TagH [Rubrivivax sp.]